MGSKARHAREIIQAMETYLGGSFSCFGNDIDYVEPFVGGANMIDKIPPAPFINRVGNDNNYHVIRMFQEVQEGWIPPDEITEGDYKRLKRMSQDQLQFRGNIAALIGFAGIGCSYSGKWFGGYARGAGRNYCLESKKNLLAQDLYGIIFTSGNYADVPIVRPSIIYCDPPYQNTTKYKTNLDHDSFWEWCRAQDNSGNVVFVSEYNAPDDWECIWSKEVNTTLVKETGSKKRTEKLFVRR